MGVQVPLSAPNKNKTNLDEKSKFVFSLQASREGSLGSFGLFFTRDYFGLIVKLAVNFMQVKANNIKIERDEDLFRLATLYKEKYFN